MYVVEYKFGSWLIRVLVVHGVVGSWVYFDWIRN
jgi:hypothetical protein